MHLFLILFIIVIIILDYHFDINHHRF